MSGKCREKRDLEKFGGVRDRGWRRETRRSEKLEDSTVRTGWGLSPTKLVNHNFMGGGPVLNFGTSKGEGGIFDNESSSFSYPAFGLPYQLLVSPWKLRRAGGRSGEETG